MKELLYTKYKLDYAYFLLENGEKKQVDAFLFSPLENKLLQTENLNLPFDASINHTKAIYFEVESGILKFVNWNYAIEADTRGYVESRFQEIENINAEDFYLNAILLEKLKQLLFFTYTICREKSSAFLKFDINQLFTSLPEEKLLYYFLKLYYFFLPTEFANKVIFINKYSDTVQNLGAFPVCEENSISVKDFSEFSPYLMQLLHQSENPIEYKIMLKFTWKEFFNYEFKLPSFYNYPDFIQECHEMIKLWNKIQESAEEFQLSDIELGYHKKLNNLIIYLMQYSIQKLYDEENFSKLLDDYKKILNLFQKNENTEIYHALYDYLYFQSMHKKTNELAYLQESFHILSDNRTNYLPEDKTYYTQVCFAYIRVAKNGLELENLIHDITLGNIPEFFKNISFSSLNQKELGILYQRIAKNALQNLQNYQGYGQDTEFQNLEKELKFVITFSEHTGFDFQKMLFQQYAKISKNYMQLQHFANYFLTKTVNLTELLIFIHDWKLEDFYTKINLAIFDALLLAIKNYHLPEEESKNLMLLLQKFKSFRENYENLLEQQEKLQNLDASIEEFCNQNLELILAHVNAYNACRSAQAKQVLLFINKNIIGNPVILLCMLQIYAEKFLGKSDQNKYSYYYQFFELLFLPFIKEDNFSMQDIKYLIWMFEKNNFLPKNQFKTIKLLQDLEKKINKTFSEILLQTQEEKIKNFKELLINKLCLKYKLQNQASQSLRKEIEIYNQKYVNFINASMLKEYYHDYISWLKKYMNHIIKKF